MLSIGGIVPFTTTDFPGRLAAVLFLQGCPWRCGYCHNPHLIRSPNGGGAPHEWSGTLRWLATRRGLLDAVALSGGEPTAQRAIAGAVAAIRELGFEVGLHTSGAYPRRLRALLSDIDWIGFDVKAPRRAYEAVTRVPASGSAAFESLDALVRSGIAYEVRTTVHPMLTPPAALECLARELAAHGVGTWVLQRFRAKGCDDEALVAAAPREAVIDAMLVDALRAHVPRISVR